MARLATDDDRRAFPSDHEECPESLGEMCNGAECLIDEKGKRHGVTSCSACLRWQTTRRGRLTMHCEGDDSRDELHLASCPEGSSTHSPESAATRGDCTQRTTDSLKVAREPTPDTTFRSEALEISFCYEPIPGRLTEVQVELMLQHRTRRLAKQPECPTREIGELA